MAKAVKYKLNISFKTCEQPYGYGSALKTNGRPSNDLFDVSPCLVWKCINIVLKPLEPWGYGVPKKMTRCRCKKKPGPRHGSSAWTRHHPGPPGPTKLDDLEEFTHIYGDLIWLVVDLPL